MLPFGDGGEDGGGAERRAALLFEGFDFALLPALFPALLPVFLPPRLSAAGARRTLDAESTAVSAPEVCPMA